MSCTLLKTGGKWSYSRSPIPLALSQAGVPEETWHDTFDRTVNRPSNFTLVPEQLKAVRKKYVLQVCFICIPFLSCIFSAILLPYYYMPIQFILYGVGWAFFACFYICNSPHGKRMKEIGEESSEHIREWGCFVEEQKVVYRPYGIQVDMVEHVAMDKDTRPSGVVIRGLKFIQVEMVKGGLIFKLAESAPPTQTSPFVQDLESLYQPLYQLIRNTPQNIANYVVFLDNFFPEDEENSMSSNSDDDSFLSIQGF